MKEKLTDKKGFVYALVPLCALSWGLSFLGTGAALKELEVFQLLAMRWTFAALIFLCLLFFRLIRIDFRGKPKKILLLTAFLQPCVYSIFETLGIKLTTTSESSIFIATIPPAVLLISALFLKKKNSGRTIFGIVMAFGGVAVCVGFSPEFSLGGKGAGYLCLLGAILAGAGYSHCSSKASEEFNTVEITFTLAVMGAVFFNVISFAMGYGFSGYRVCMEQPKIFFGVLFLGVFCSCLCYLIYNYVLAKLPTAIGTNLVSNSTTAVGVVSGCLFAGDPFGWYTAAGLALTICGICVSSGAGKKFDSKEAPTGEKDTNNQILTKM